MGSVQHGRDPALGLYVGLMSGTSLDALDAVLATFGQRSIRLFGAGVLAAAVQASGAAVVIVSSGRQRD